MVPTRWCGRAHVGLRPRVGNGVKNVQIIELLHRVPSTMHKDAGFNTTGGVRGPWFWTFPTALCFGPGPIVQIQLKHGVEVTATITLATVTTKDVNHVAHDGGRMGTTWGRGERPCVFRWHMVASGGKFAL